MRPQARGLAHHGDFTGCPGLGLLSCERLGNPAAAAAGLLLNIHKQPT